MTDTLKDVLEAVYFRLGELHAGVVDSGGSGSTVDATLGGRQDDWNGGVLFVDYDAGALGAAPQGQYAEVSAYAKATGTLTHTAFTAAAGADDQYSLATPRYPMAVMVAIVNQRLKAMGDIPAVDSASLSFVSGQSLYTIPAAARGGRLKQVWQATSSDADDPGLMPRFDWDPRGVSDLVFSGPIDSGDALHLVYIGPHGRLGIYSDTLSPYIHLDLIAADAAYWAMRLHGARGRGSSKEQKDTLQLLFNEWESAKKEHKIKQPMRHHQSLGIFDDVADGGRSGRYGPWLP